MKRLEKMTLLSIMGGRNEKMCAGLQYVANHYGSVMTDEEWDEWLTEYDTYC